MTKRPNSDWWRMRVITAAELYPSTNDRPVRPPKRITSERIEQIECLLAEGRGFKEIAMRVGVTPYVVAVVAGDVERNAQYRKDGRYRRAGKKGGNRVRWGRSEQKLVDATCGADERHGGKR